MNHQPRAPPQEKIAKVYIACDRCKSRKRKCDGLIPRCGLCTSQDAQCVYAPARRMRGPGKKSTAAAAAPTTQITTDAGTWTDGQAIVGNHGVIGAAATSPERGSMPVHTESFIGSQGLTDNHLMAGMSPPPSMQQGATMSMPHGALLSSQSISQLEDPMAGHPSPHTFYSTNPMEQNNVHETADFQTPPQQMMLPHQQPIHPQHQHTANHNHHGHHHQHQMYDQRGAAKMTQEGYGMEPQRFVQPDAVDHHLNAVKANIAQANATGEFVVLLPSYVARHLVSRTFESIIAEHDLITFRDLVIVMEHQYSQGTAGPHGHPAQWAVTNVFLALALSHIKDTTHFAGIAVIEVAHAYYRNATKIVPHLLLGDPCLPSVQALLAMSLFARGDTQDPTASSTYAIHAMRQLEVLGTRFMLGSSGLAEIQLRRYRSLHKSAAFLSGAAAPP